MTITEFDKVKSARKIGEVYLWEDTNDPDYDRKLRISYEKDLSNSFLKEQQTIVYLIVVDGEIYKIGGSSTASGFKGLLGLYMRTTGAPGSNRYIVNRLMHKYLEEGKRVEFYAVYIPSYMREIPTPDGPVFKRTVDTHTTMESEWISKYREKNNGEYPIWNFQECPKNRNSLYEKFNNEWKDYRNKKKRV